ncbi:Outer membrane lipoprotein omp16 precursor [Lunatimonas lonarensis]|uniref:Outer membrane lipoprotein omp16 n=1 Tax=Lunatimonas lonarensis TaxID=1232681 RepID=R7ZU02_9BACT|nr:OmpA family protein [Lunatimonas lonarensis]EON77590.1 Outer membrane lipoprotein omp16 precursor [Lunatimonas lonarensis]
MLRRLLLCVTVFVCPLILIGQQEYSIIDKRAIRFYEEGERFLGQRQWDEAAHNYRAAYERSSDFFEAYLRHAQVLLRKGSPDAALEIAEKGERRIKGQQRFKGQFGFLISEIYFQKGDFQPAIERMEQSLPFLDETITSSEHFKLRSKQMDFIGEQLLRPKDITKERLPDPLNRFRLQYFPVLTADSKKILFTKRDGILNHEHEDIFVSYLEEDASWAEPEPISQVINSRFNEGTCTISADGNMLIFTSCDTPDSFGSCDLYISQKEKGVWQRPVNMGKNVNSRFWDSQPSLSADGRVLFFSSNRRDGFGGNDIWFSRRKEDGSWGVAENLGPTINTERDEVSPFIFFNNEVLFFASDGHLGFGGKDLFLSRFEGGAFGEPENLGYPINDQNDQLALFITAQMDYAYYTQNLFQSGRLDSSFLYRFNFPREIYLGEMILVTEGLVRDGKTGLPIDARLSLVRLDNDSTLYEFRSDGKTGEFVMLYPDKAQTGLYVERDGFIPKIFNVEKDSLKNRDNLVISLDPIESGNYFIFENVFFEFDKSDFQGSSVSSLNRLVNFLERNAEIRIRIEGHTDNVGNPGYNERLSLQRAQSVKDFLVQKGILSDRVIVVGKGDKSPMVPNDSDENRALNRRIEVVIQ